MNRFTGSSLVPIGMVFAPSKLSTTLLFSLEMNNLYVMDPFVSVLFRSPKGASFRKDLFCERIIDSKEVRCHGLKFVLQQ